MTSRILVVDMLNGLIPWHKLGGIIYYMAPGMMINENSTENFIMRIYAQQVYWENKNREHRASRAADPSSSSSLATGAVAFDGYNDVAKAVVPEFDLNRTINIKAFTESPSSLARGWNTLEKVMHELKVGTKVFIWPRFRKSVKECLEAHKPEVLQVHVDMAPLQDQIHRNLLSIFKICVEDLKTRCSQGTALANSISSLVSNAAQSSGTGVQTPLNAQSTSDTTTKPMPPPLTDISYSTALFTQFDSSIKAILEPLGSKVPRKIRLLLQDIKIVRELLRMLFRCDAVQFYEKFQRIIRDHSMDSTASLDWLHYKEAEAVSHLSQERLWRTPPPQSVFANANEKNQPSAPPLVLEDNPKWRSLLSVLQEIEIENSNDKLQLGTQPIIILVKDETMRFALAQYLSMRNPSLYLLSKLKRHVSYKVQSFACSRHARKIPKKQNFFADTKQSSTKPKYGASSSKKFNKGSNGGNNDNTEVDVIDVDAEAPENQPLSAADIEKQGLYNSLLEQVEMQVQREFALDGANMNQGEEEEDFSGKDFERYFGLVKSQVDTSTSLRSAPIIIQSWETTFHTIPSLLDDVRPHFIILYDADPAVVRQVECYKCNRPGWFVRLYAMIYKDSLEEDKIKATLVREKEVMHKLVDQKSKLAPKDAETEADIIRRQVSKDTAGGTRQGGGGGARAPNLVLGTGILSTTSASPSSKVDQYVPRLGSNQFTEEIVIVDTREFRSKLPGMLHQSGITIKPVTLIIADYILSPDIAVERKAIADLRQSLSKGRLYNQVENLTRIYAKPVLLIEFDSSEAFELNTKESIYSGFTSSDVSAKLVLLSKAFPKLRICWSRSPAETAQLFLMLKRGKMQPSVSQVSLNHAGLNPELSTHSEENGATASSSTADDKNPKSTDVNNPLTPNLAPFYPIDILKRLPGLDRGTEWKSLLFPPVSPAGSRDTSPTKLNGHTSSNSASPTNNSPTRASTVTSVSSHTSPTKLSASVPPEVPLDGSLFEIDDDEEEVDSEVAGGHKPPGSAELAPLAFPSRQTPSPAPIRSAAAKNTGPVPLTSLSALSSMSLESLETAIGKKHATQLHQFLNYSIDKSALIPMLGNRATSENRKGRSNSAKTTGKRAKSGGGGRFGGGPATTRHR